MNNFFLEFVGSLLKLSERYGIGNVLLIVAFLALLFAFFPAVLAFTIGTLNFQIFL